MQVEAEVVPEDARAKAQRHPARPYDGRRGGCSPAQRPLERPCLRRAATPGRCVPGGIVSVTPTTGIPAAVAAARIRVVIGETVWSLYEQHAHAVVVHAARSSARPPAGDGRCRPRSRARRPPASGCAGRRRRAGSPAPARCRRRASPAYRARIAATSRSSGARLRVEPAQAGAVGGAMGGVGAAESRRDRPRRSGRAAARRTRGAGLRRRRWTPSTSATVTTSRPELGAAASSLSMKLS